MQDLEAVLGSGHCQTAAYCFRKKLRHRYCNWQVPRGGSRTAAIPKMELFVIIVNRFQPLTIITKCSILDVAAVLDMPLVPQHASEGIFPLSFYLALSVRMWENAGKIRTRITPNTNTIYAIFGIILNLEFHI